MTNTKIFLRPSVSPISRMHPPESMAYLGMEEILGAMTARVSEDPPLKIAKVCTFQAWFELVNYQDLLE